LFLLIFHSFDFRLSSYIFVAFCIAFFMKTMRQSAMMMFAHDDLQR